MTASFLAGKITVNYIIHAFVGFPANHILFIHSLKLKKMEKTAHQISHSEEYFMLLYLVFCKLNQFR